jgi:hypothetical protein
MAKPTITTRAGKGSPLTSTEVDTNFTNIKDATLTVKAGSGGTDVVSDLNGIVTLVAGTNVTLSGDNTAKTVTINASGGSGITDLVQDTTPQLGGQLDVNGQSIVSASNGNINISPNGSGNISLTPATGKITLGALDFPTGMGTNGYVLTTNGSSAMSWAAASGGGNNMILIHSGQEYITIGTSGTSESWTLATAGGISGVSVSTNTFTLPAGTYFLELPYTFSNDATGYDFRLRNTTDSVDTALITSNTVSHSGVTKKVYWQFQTHFTIAASKTFMFRTNSGSFQANMGYTTNGFYTVKIMKY